MSEHEHIPSTNDRLPWSLIAAALAAGAALYITGKKPVILPPLAVLLVASEMIGWRLPSRLLAAWGMRAILFAVIVLVVGLPRSTSNSWYFEPEYTRLIGCLLCGELVLRAWQRPAHPREARGVVVLLTAMIMGAATNTYHRQHIQFLAPIYALSMVLSLRSFGRVGQTAAATRKRKDLILLRTAVIALALLSGFVTVYVVTRYNYKLTDWAMKMMRDETGRQEEIGMAGTPQLLPVYNPEESMDRVLLIDGPRSERYLRVLAFDVYGNREWRPLLRGRQFALPQPADLKPRKSGPRLRFRRLESNSELLALPLEAAGVDSPRPLLWDSFRALSSERWVYGPYECVLPAHPSDQGPLCEPPTAEERARLLGLPGQLDPAVIELARKVAGSGNPAERVWHIQQHLRSTHKYSLSYQPKGEPLNDFILNGGAAHCQYFASALVVMARAVGVPARFVTGYYAHEAGEAGQMVVRDRDAHAWAECWIDGAGWITADATPAGGRPDGLFSEPTRWRRWIEHIEDIPGAVRDWLTGPGQTVTLWIAMPAIALFIGWLVHLTWQARRRPPAGPAYATSSAELAAAAQRFDRWLIRQGFPCASTRTWREHLATLQNPPTPPEFGRCHRFVVAYEQARFGGGEQLLMSRVRDLLDDLEQQRTRA